MHEHERIGKFLPLMQSLYNTAREKLGFEPHVKIVILRDSENMNNPLGKTAHYSPADMKIGLYTQGRHIKDILRSMSHELVHHHQNCRGDFNDGAATTKGYAQEDGHLREMEREAYEQGNLIFRDWEDNLKDKGARPLFTSTAQHVPSPTTDVVGEGMVEENKMTKKINESHLRNTVREVIQEMFNEDLNEMDNMGMPADAEAQEAEEHESEIVEGGKMPSAHTGTQKGDFKKTGPADVPAYEGDKESVTEDSGRDEEEHYDRNVDDDEDHIDAIRHHLDKLEHDKDYDEDHEAIKETYFPQQTDIRSEARSRTFEGLMSRWGYTNKENK